MGGFGRRNNFIRTAQNSTAQRSTAQTAEWLAKGVNSLKNTPSLTRPAVKCPKCALFIVRGILLELKRFSK